MPDENAREKRNNGREKEKALFYEALRLEPEDRTAFLMKECGDDPRLLEEIRSLLRNHGEAKHCMKGTLLPVSARGILERKDPERIIVPPERIGAYKIIKVLGEGGMGIVYLAEQQSPIVRQVALKVIKLGMNTEEVLARFDLEKRALAMMNHSAIARAFDAGATEQGQPYFAMEYVEGLSITKYCDDHRLNLDQRLRLFIEVCNGIQHAHQKRIIHRDLKPSNVLVVREGDRDVPKIIDFGVARAMDQRFGPHTTATKLGALIGTPEYMSPEQAELNTLDIDTRTDIYTLGVLLYELLLGKLPFVFSGNGRKRYSDIRNEIRNEIPVKPSQRIGSLGPEREEIARKRGMSPNAFRRRLRGDLDWIVMKAMEKERTRRYASASEMAADIQRHLDDEPILAGPPGALYLLRKTISRHKTAFFGILTLILILIAGLSVSTFFYVESEKAKARAHGLLDDYRKLADLSILERLKDQEKRLWPARDNMVPEMERWLREARDLASRLETHERTLLKMRKNALPYDEESRRQDQAMHPQAEKLRILKSIDEVMQKRIEGDLPPPRSTGADKEKKHKIEIVREYSRKIKKQIADLEETIASTRLTWHFADGDDQLLHDKLADLVIKLKEFDSESGLIRKISDRIEKARDLKKRTVDDVRDAWKEAIRSIEDPDGIYRGLSIKPQIGLIPLGRDPLSGFWEFAHLETGKMAVTGGEDGIFRVDENTGMVFVLLPGGEFRMGANARDEDSDNYDPHAYPREEPVHTVRLDPFFLSKYEMTRGQYYRVTGKTPSFSLPGEDQDFVLPVDQVSWFDCHEVLTKLGLDLPTEAQWEYADRAGTHSIWYTGHEEKSLEGHANLADVTGFQGSLPKGKQYIHWLVDHYDRAAPVGRFKPNGFGFYDMVGNVYEWCLDFYDVYEMPVRPGTGERLGDPDTCKYRIVRGGNYQSLMNTARSSFRVDCSPNTTSMGHGVRPARKLDE